MDEQGFVHWGLPQSDTVALEDLSAHIHPADRDRVRAAFTATSASCWAKSSTGFRHAVWAMIPSLLAIAAGLTRISARSTTTAKEMANVLTDRLTALGLAHDLVRPLPGKRAVLPCWAIC
ncbi:hypothetical protein [Devosia salina]|uniref:hypothetical protein n=1 Tax=Devosia salina TaxID=2860336 RepID=UPI0030840AC5